MTALAWAVFDILLRVNPNQGMPALSVIIHERVANWSSQLKPRFQGWAIRWSETRSASSLTLAASRSSCPVLIVGLDDQPLQALFALSETLQVVPNAFTLVLDPLDRPEVAATAREIGATICLSGPVVPPEVERLLRRWLPIAQARENSEGWSASFEPETEIWEDLEFFRSPSHPVPDDDLPD